MHDAFLPTAAAWALIPLVAFLDGLAGGRPNVPGRGVWYGAVALGLFVAALGVHLAFAVSVGVGYYVWRDTAPGEFGGRIDPRTDGELAGTFFRHILVVLMGAPLLVHPIAHELPVPGLWWVLGLFPFVATAIAAWLGDHYQDRSARIIEGLPVGKDRANDYAEWGRGAALGLVLALLLLS